MDARQRAVLLRARREHDLFSLNWPNLARVLRAAVATGKDRQAIMATLDKLILTAAHRVAIEREADYLLAEREAVAAEMKESTHGKQKR